MDSTLLGAETTPLPVAPGLTPVVQDTAEQNVSVNEGVAPESSATSNAPTEHRTTTESTSKPPTSQDAQFLTLTPAAEPAVETLVERSPAVDSDSSTESSSTSNSQTGASSLSSPSSLAPVADNEAGSKIDDNTSLDSGFSSGNNSSAGGPLITLSPTHIEYLNDQLEYMHPMDILRFAKVLFPNLYQTTAFGLTGLATIDMLSKIEDKSKPSKPVDLIFLDTLYHFPETYDLVERVKTRYPNLTMHTFKPDGVETVKEFEDTYGEKLYEMSAELYDWIAKVEPQQRAFETLQVAAVLTGRRRSQGAQRAKIPVIEIDEERSIIKINPLVTWSFQQVRDYIRDNNVPYNVLLDRGYKSIGDWHSTSPVGEGEDERAGRWKGQDKTECGIHNKKSRYAQFLQGGAAESQGQQITAA